MAGRSPGASAVVFAISIPDGVLEALAGVLVGGLIGVCATGMIAFLTQKWIERRERRNRRDDLRLSLYLKIVDLVLDNERALAERGSDGHLAPIELQVKRIEIVHRLKLLGSQCVRGAYETYHFLVLQETEYSREYRPEDPDEVSNARDKLIEAMARDVQC